LKFNPDSAGLQNRRKTVAGILGALQEPAKGQISEANVNRKGKAMIDFKCPKCGKALSVPASLVGHTETCPSCGNITIVPQPTIAEDRAWYPPLERSVGKRWSGFGIAGFVVALCSIPLPLPQGTFHQDVRAVLIGLTFVGAFVATVLSAVGINQVSSGHRERGKGLSIAGLIIGVVDLVLTTVYASVGIW
jgi:predicted RNA-binding Zn-ribbon protein involved in translation (DUF1610 family)